MAERKYDRLLGIDTVGLREWRSKDTEYNRYEATPYRALDRLFQSYRFNPQDQVVDFGCGRGRVAFAIHNRFRVPVTGIEANDKTFAEALRNKPRYRARAHHISAPIRFEFGLAEHYEVKPGENRFYFFNPFSKEIFKQVVSNILHSVAQNHRSVDIILYYPLPEYKRHLKKRTPFEIANKIKVPNATDKHDKFLVYRLKPKQHQPKRR